MIQCAKSFHLWPMSKAHFFNCNILRFNRSHWKNHIINTHYIQIKYKYDYNTNTIRIVIALRYCIHIVIIFESVSNALNKHYTANCLERKINSLNSDSIVQNLSVFYIFFMILRIHCIRL